eukprot:3683690-Ditylum_brightwellii.AAC.1
MPTNNDGVVFKQHADPNNCMAAREGDWLCALFWCNFCWFQNLKYLDADPSSFSDLHLLDHIRQVTPPYLPRDPWPLDDKVGFKVALQIVRSSLEPGRYSLSQTFDTIKHLKSTYANTFMCSTTTQLSGLYFQGDRGSSYHLLAHDTHSPLFNAFMAKLEHYMGRDGQPNMGLNYQVFYVILENIDKDLIDTTLHWEKKRFLLLGLLEHTEQGTMEKHKDLSHMRIMSGHSNEPSTSSNYPKQQVGSPLLF